jgi:hypothetical protein
LLSMRGWTEPNREVNYVTVVAVGAGVTQVAAT